MKKSDIIKLVKETIKEIRGRYGQHDYYGNNVGGRNSISGFPGVQEDDDFKKQYMTKINPEDFKNKIPVGREVKYMGSSYKVIKNDGYILTIKDLKDGEIKTVNLNMFSHGGKINEKDMKNKKTEAVFVGKKQDTFLKAKDTDSYAQADSITKQAIQQALKDGEPVELNELPGEEPEMTNDMGKDNWMDDEGRFAKMQLQKAAEYSVKLSQMLDDMTQLPAWVQSKITRASDYMSMVYHYLDYEMERANDNLMEHIEKERKRTRLMEGATEKLFKLFNAGKTDAEVRAYYLQMNVDMPESFVAKLRNNWESLRKTKLDLTLADKEAEGFEKIQTEPEITGMEPGVEEEKQLASGLFNESKSKKSK
jgi:hypothetical protein